MSDSDMSNYICSRQGLQLREVLEEQGRRDLCSGKVGCRGGAKVWGALH